MLCQDSRGIPLYVSPESLVHTLCLGLGFTLHITRDKDQSFLLLFFKEIFNCSPTMYYIAHHFFFLLVSLSFSTCVVWVVYLSHIDLSVLGHFLTVPILTVLKLTLKVHVKLSFFLFQSLFLVSLGAFHFHAISENCLSVSDNNLLGFWLWFLWGTPQFVRELKSESQWVFFSVAAVISIYFLL